MSVMTKRRENLQEQQHSTQTLLDICDVTLQYQIDDYMDAVSVLNDNLDAHSVDSANELDNSYREDYNTGSYPFFFAPSKELSWVLPPCIV